MSREEWCLHLWSLHRLEIARQRAADANDPGMASDPNLSWSGKRWADPMLTELLGSLPADQRSELVADVLTRQAEDLRREWDELSEADREALSEVLLGADMLRNPGAYSLRGQRRMPWNTASEAA